MLDIAQETADRWGHLSGTREATVPVIDGLLAAVAIHHNLTLARVIPRTWHEPASHFSIPGQTKAIVGRGTQMNCLNYERPCMRLLTA
jgi:hypothetical protein